MSLPLLRNGKENIEEKIFSWHGPLIVNYEPYHGIKSKGVVPPIMSIRRKCLFEIILDYWHAAFQTLHWITINNVPAFLCRSPLEVNISFTKSVL